MVIEGTSARSAFNTTSGFRDLPEMGAHHRPSGGRPVFDTPGDAVKLPAANETTVAVPDSNGKTDE